MSKLRDKPDVDPKVKRLCPKGKPFVGECTTGQPEGVGEEYEKPKGGAQGIKDIIQKIRNSIDLDSHNDT